MMQFSLIKWKSTVLRKNPERGIQTLPYYLPTLKIIENSFDAKIVTILNQVR